MSTGADGEIRSLLARVAQLADAGTIEEYLELFTEDAGWEMPANPAAGAPADRRVGRVDIGAGVRARRAAGVQGPGTATRHVVTSIAVDVESAAAVSYWMFFADTSTVPRLVSLGRYDDRLRRVDGRWRLAYRTITVG
ncbi:MAG TPA: nuclear transport factor 2 family protein [Mycobacteriales bacterium]|nr:nuclear transport factor 2 family protein [Mycobacteriales bacterium]